MPGSHSCHVRDLLPPRPGLHGCVRVLLLVTSGPRSCHVRAFVFASRSHSCYVRVPMAVSGSYSCHVRVPFLPCPGPSGCIRVPLLPRPGPNGCVRVPLLPRPGPHGCTWVPLLPRPGPHPGSHPIWLLKIYEGARWVFPVARHARHCSQGGVLKGGVGNEVELTEIDCNPMRAPNQLQTHSTYKPPQPQRPVNNKTSCGCKVVAGCEENVALQGPSSGYLEPYQNQPRPSGPPWSGLAVLKMIQMRRYDVVCMLTWMLTDVGEAASGMATLASKGGHNIRC